MATIFTLSITDASVTANNPGRKSSEVDFILYAMQEVAKEFARGNGTVTSGTIQGVSAAGVSPTSLGTWTYSPQASNP